MQVKIYFNQLMKLFFVLVDIQNVPACMAILKIYL